MREKRGPGPGTLAPMPRFPLLFAPRLIASISLVLAAAPRAADAQALAGAASPFAGTTVDAVGRYEHLSGAFASTRTLGVSLVMPQTATAWWRADLVAGQHLGQGDVLFGLAHTRDFGPRVYASAAVSGSPGSAIALPAARADAMGYVRLGAQKRLVVGAGGFYVRAHDEHRDAGLVGEVQWYPRDGLTVQAGGRLMRSTPGDAPGQHAYASATLGRAGTRFVALRVGASHEAYQVLRPLVTYVDFNSREASLTWREWTGARGGVTVGTSVYQNPYYTRAAVSVGVFHTLR